MTSLWIYIYALIVAFSVHGEAQCYADNCYRAMFPCRTNSAAAYTSATKYCDTRTFEGSTRTNYPTHATAACHANQEKIFSACICGPLCSPQQGPCSPPPAPQGAVFYDSLECQLPQVETTVNAVRYAILDGGFNGRAFKTWVGVHKGAVGIYPILVRYKNIPIETNKVVRISLKVQFRHGDSGGILIRAEDDRIKEWFFSPLEPEIWSDFSVDFTPHSDTVSFSIAFNFSSKNAWIRIDEVTVAYVQ